MMCTEVLEGHLIAQVDILLSIINITTYTILKNVLTSRQWYIKLKINSHCDRNKLIIDIFFEESGTHQRPLLRSNRFSSQRICISA